jgi:hypothetical protein
MGTYILQSVKLVGYILFTVLLAIMLSFVYGMAVFGVISDEVTAEAVMSVIFLLSVMLILFFFMFNKGFDSNEYSDKNLTGLKMFSLTLLPPTFLLFLYFIIIEHNVFTAWFFICANPSGNIGLTRDPLMEYIKENHNYMIFISALLHTFLLITFMVLSYIGGWKKRAKKRTIYTKEEL